MKIVNFNKKKMNLSTKDSRNHMKIQKSVKFVKKKKLKINTLKIKSTVKLETVAIPQENIEVLHIANII